MKFFRTVTALCSGFQSYRACRDLPISSSLKYLVQLMTVLALLLTLATIPWLLRVGNEFARWAEEHLPRFAIQDGKLVTSAPQPARVQRGDAMFILDTTGQVTSPETNAPHGVLFGAETVTVWVSDLNVKPPVIVQRVAPLRGFPNGVVDAAYWQRLLRTSVGLLAPFAWIGLALGGMLTCLIQAYLFSLVAALLERSLPRPMSLPQLLNIAIHAVTPAAIIVTAYLAMLLDVMTANALWIIYLIAYGVFLIGATNACRDENPEPPQEDDLL